MYFSIKQVILALKIFFFAMVRALHKDKSHRKDGFQKRFLKTEN